MPESIYQHLQAEVKSREKDDLSAADYEQILTTAFLECDGKLNDNIETNLSGTTVCAILFDGTRMHCANLGDSRGMKVKLVQSGDKFVVETE